MEANDKNNFLLGIWVCAQYLVKQANMTTTAAYMLKDLGVSLESQKRLQDYEGNSYQEEMEHFWKLEYGDSINEQK